MKIIEIIQNTLKRRSHDSHDCRESRLTAVVKVNYVSLRNKGKDNFQVLVFNRLVEIFVEAISFKINGFSN